LSYGCKGFRERIVHRESCIDKFHGLTRELHRST